MLFRASTAPEIFNMFFWNIIIVSAYHFIIFAICVKLPQSSFDENKSRYQMKKFERNGKFYKQTLKINVWKEHVPQFTGKDGFSKEHMSNNVSVEYLNEFIAETCRAEWTHETRGLSAWDPKTRRPCKDRRRHRLMWEKSAMHQKRRHALWAVLWRK